MTIELQILQSKENPGEAPHAMFVSELILSIVLALFEVAVGVYTSLMLKDTNVTPKLPIYIFIWILLFTYITV